MPQKCISPAHSADETTQSESLRAQFRIAPQDGAGCAVLDSSSNATDIVQNVVCADGDCSPGCTCRALVSEPEIDESKLVSGPTSDTCICTVFREHDCVASLDGIEDGEFVVSLTTVDRAQLTEVVSALRDIGATVKLQRITQGGESHHSRLLELETGSITVKQRQAVELAVEMGYYDSPRRTDLSELADHLGISRSAVSQRLRAVESKLVCNLAAN